MCIRTAAAAAAVVLLFVVVGEIKESVVTQRQVLEWNPTAYLETHPKKLKQK